MVAMSIANGKYYQLNKTGSIILACLRILIQSESCVRRFSVITGLTVVFAVKIFLNS